MKKTLLILFFMCLFSESVMAKKVKRDQLVLRGVVATQDYVEVNLLDNKKVSYKVHTNRSNKNLLHINVKKLKSSLLASTVIVIRAN